MNLIGFQVVTVKEKPEEEGKMKITKDILINKHLKTHQINNIVWKTGKQENHNLYFHSVTEDTWS